MKQTMIILMMVLLVTVACNSNTPEEVAPILAPTQAARDLPQMVDVLTQDRELALFVSALNGSGVMADISGVGPYTVFAVSNLGLARLGVVPQQLDPYVLREMMQYHIVNGRVATAEFGTTNSVETLQGHSISLRNDDGTMMANYAQLTMTDIETANGIIHIVDDVLLPQETGPSLSIWGTLQADGRFSRLIEMMEGSDVMYMLRFSDFPDAFLAPIDQAFTDLPEGTLEPILVDEEILNEFLSYHVLIPDGWPSKEPFMVDDIRELEHINTSSHINSFNYAMVAVTPLDDRVMINNAHIIDGDIEASNGMVHVIDQFLIPLGLLEGH